MVIYINIRRTLFIWVLLENYQIDLKEHIELIVITSSSYAVPVLLKFAKNHPLQKNNSLIRNWRRT
jgi:hypothetical protein